jgi:cell wall-associated NlpC family hydrolase
VARYAVRRSLVFLAVVAIAVLGGASAVRAEPSVAEIEKQIDEKWAQLEPAIEKHNATRQDLAARKKQAASLGKKISPLQLQVELAMQQVTDLVVEDYKIGNTAAIVALLDSGSPSVLTERLGIIDQFAKRQANSVQKVADLRQKYADEKAPLDAMIAELTQTEKALAAKTKQIDVEIEKLQKLRLQAYGSGTSLGDLRPAPCPSVYPGGKAGIAVKFACAQIGKPYVWGADGPGGYDCSGLTSAAWRKAGVSLPHNAAAQRGVVKSVKESDLRPGDLVFYYGDIHHVGMYVGNGWLVHASRAGVPVLMKRYDDGNVNSFGRPG